MMKVMHNACALTFKWILNRGVLRKFFHTRFYCNYPHFNNRIFTKRNAFCKYQ
jgi:hypothetical protein